MGFVCPGKTFIPYNYGWLGNLMRYGQTSPPPYDLKKITAPVYIFYGPNDLLVVEEASSKINNSTFFKD